MAHPSLLRPAEMEPRHVSPEKAAPLSGEVPKSHTGVSRAQHMVQRVPGAQLAGAEPAPVVLSSLSRLGLFLLASVMTSDLFSSVCELMWHSLCREAFVLLFY